MEFTFWVGEADQENLHPSIYCSPLGYEPHYHPSGHHYPLPIPHLIKPLYYLLCVWPSRHYL